MKKIYIFKHYPPPSPSPIPFGTFALHSHYNPLFEKTTGSAPEHLLNMSEQVWSVTRKKSSDFHGGIRFQSSFTIRWELEDKTFLKINIINFIPFSNSVTFRKPRGTDLVTASELIPGFCRSKSKARPQASNPRPHEIGLKPIAFLPFSLPSPASLLKLSIVVIQKFCYHGNMTSHFS